MRGALLAMALVAVTLAGCSDGPSVPDLRAFNALYEDKDGNRVRVELRAPVPILGADGQPHEAYLLVSGYAGAEGARAERVQALGPDLRPVRDSGCYALGEGEPTCVHHHIGFVPYYDIADYGIGLPAFLDGEPHAGLLRIPDPRVDPEDDPEATSYFEYKPGRLWPERYLRAAPAWDFEETLLRLVEVDEGDALPAIPAWPTPPPPAPLASFDELFPGADTAQLDVPFTPAEAVEALRQDEASRQALDGGCVVGLHIWSDRPPPDQLLPLPQVALSTRTGSMWVETLTASGVHHGWMVYQEQDTFGATTLRVEGNDHSFHSSTSCSDREAAVVPIGDFVAAVPDAIAQGRLGGLTIEWWRERPGEGARARYTVQYEPQPEGAAHWRSATMHAGTGQWAGFTFLAGDALEPAGAEQNG